MIDKERAHNLMMAALDEEITPEERAELDRLLAREPDLRKEWERMSQVKEATRELGFREPPEEVWSDYWTSVYNRMERGFGWVLISISSIVLLCWAAWKVALDLMQSSDIPLLIKTAILTLITGGIIVFVSVVREKLFTHKRDPYKEIHR